MTSLQMTTFWLGVVLISLSWRVAFRLVAAPDAGLTILVCIAGICCVVISGATGRSGPRSFISSLIAAGGVFLISGVSTGILLRVAPCLHDIDIPGGLAPIVESMSDRFGITNSLLTFWDGHELHMVRLTCEGFGLYEIWYIVTGLVAAGLALGTAWRPAEVLGTAARLIVVILLYALIRFAVVTGIAIEFGKPQIIWHPATAVASYLPLAYPIGLASGQARSWRAMPLDRLKALGLTAALLLGSTVVLNLPYGSTAQPGPARVIIDESHSDWEWTTVPFDTTSFGIRAEYNYSCFKNYIGQFHEVSVNFDPIDAKIVGGCDILIVKTPTEAYSPHEIDTIVEFVQAGGGLFLIGDHTNLFGMTTHLNAIAGRFGMQFRNDDTFDLATGGFSSTVPLGLWTHPLVRDIERFGFLTSCTIEGGPGIEPIIIGCGLGSEDGDYGHPNFFGNISYDLADRFGVFLQAAGKRFGTGKVLLFTDSTCFSNFCMFSPGTPELTLRFLKYLSCGSRCPDVPQGRGRSRTVLVDTTHSKASYFGYAGYTRRPAWQRFEEFYISLARVGMFPAGGEIGDLDDVDARGLVIVNPGGQFTRREIEAVLGFVKSGGTLLVLDGVANSESAANELLQAFQLGIAMRPVSAGRCAGTVNAAACSISAAGFSPGLEVFGGEALITDSSGRVTALRAPHGEGSVLVIVDSYAYSAAGLGRPLQHTQAYSPCRDRYRALFAVLEELR